MKKNILFLIILFPIIALGRIADLKICNDVEFLAASPQVTVSVTSLAAFSSCIQTTSSSQNFTISGSFLTAEISITSAAGFTISKDDINFGSTLIFPHVSGNVPNSVVYVRMAPTSASNSGIITIASVNAVSKTVAVSGTVGFTTTWNGTSWNPVAPTSTMNAFIEGNYSQAADINACYLTISNGANANIPSGYNVVLSGALTVDFGSTFTLENNAGLLQSGTTNPNSGAIKVKRNSSFLNRLDYTIWSSPTFGEQSIQGFAIGTVPTRIYFYNSATNLFNVLPNPSSTNFATGNGYLIRTPNDHSTTGAIWTGEFLGKPNSGDINVSMNNFGVGFGYNFVGNPYPSPIDATAFVELNSANITGTLYFYRKTNNVPEPPYATWSTAGFVSNGNPESVDPNGIIQTGQGFLVEAIGSATNLVFTNSMRSNTNVDQFFRNTNPQEYNRIWLNATSSEGLFSQMLISYFTDGSDQLDSSDGKSITDGAISLTSIIQTVPHTIQGRSLPFTPTDSVPLQFMAKRAGTYSIAIDHVDGIFAEEQDVFLRDTQIGIDHNLKSGPYTFVTAAGTFANRFSIVYQNPLSVENATFNSSSVVVYNNYNTVIINSPNALLNQVEIYDGRGRVMAFAKNINANEISLNVETTNQLLIVKIISADGITVTKKTIN